MAQVKLKKIISQKNPLSSVIDNLVRLSGTRITVGDLDGNVLFDSVDLNQSEVSETFSIICADQDIGYVTGGDWAGLIAEFISVIADQEQKKKALGKEVLDLYREINLLYNLSDKLGTSLNLSTVAQLALTEASRLIPATTGSILLFNEEIEEYTSIASIGGDIALDINDPEAKKILDKVRKSGTAVIINDVKSGGTETLQNNQIRSLICVPLKRKAQTSGIILVASDKPDIYKAADLNLLNTVASQASPVIESAFQYQQAMEESKRREKILKKQIQELKIELNEAKQEQRVAEITETDYFRRLRKQANQLRDIINSDDQSGIEE